MTIPTVLHYFRCRNCAGIIITGIKSGAFEPCNGCESYAKHLFSEPVQTLEERDCAELVAKHGRVFRYSPSHDPLGYTPSRHEMPFPPPLKRSDMDSAERDDQERMEAAHRAAEEQPR